MMFAVPVPVVPVTVVPRAVAKAKKGKALPRPVAARRRTLADEPSIDVTPIAVDWERERVRVGHAKRTENANKNALAISLALDGSSRFVGTVGDAFLDDMLTTLAVHSGFDVIASFNAGVPGFVQEERDPLDAANHAAFVGEVLGLSFLSAVGYARTDRRRLRRLGSTAAIQDEAYVHVSLELAEDNMSYVGTHDARDAHDESESESEDPARDVSQLALRLLCTFAHEARVRMHILLVSGVHSRPLAHAQVKALGIALRAATKEA